MAETLIENQVCATCGTDVRPAALFCYNCGAAVAEKIPSNNHQKKEKSSRKTIVKENENNSKIENDLINQSEEIEKENASFAETKPEPTGKDNVKLKSAAALRNKARRIEPKKVEIIWEEHENAPNLWFIGVAVLLVIFTIIIYFIAMSLK